MLNKLSIRNYALIEHLELNFHAGFSVITGETGAGKSILLGAFSLVLGNRADSGVILNDKEKCVVEAEFDVANIDLADFFERNNLDYQPKSILRREINPEGKSRSFINDTPVNLTQLKEIGARLVDIHSQHESLELNKSDFQLQLMDAYAGCQDLIKKYRVQFQNWKDKGKKHAELKSKEESNLKELDYHTYLFDELARIGLKEGEVLRIETELEVLNNAEKIKADLEHAASVILSDEQNLSAVLNQVVQQLQSTASLFPDAAVQLDRLRSLHIDLKDIGQEIEQLSSHLNPDPVKLEKLNERMSQIFDLQQKHRLTNAEELLKVKEELESKLDTYSGFSAELDAVSKEIMKLENELMEMANEISSKRENSIRKMEKEVVSMLSEVGMPTAKFSIELTKEKLLNEQGINRIHFLFSANKGLPLSDISKVASGGELSRLLLSLKSLVSKKTNLPSMVFDEIDTGISGETAMKVGDMLFSMANGQQIICITHLPQIAARGSHHYFVFKDLKSKHPYTRVSKLSEKERLSEIAKMLSGDSPGAAALENAKELLNRS